MKEDESLEARGFAGLTGDIRRRGALYAQDWRDGLHPKVLGATLFLFFACLAPAVAFGGLMSILTKGSIGAVEMIVATSVGGVLYAVFSGQPLTILGGTGPLLVFTGVLYETCVRLGIPFLATYAWIGLWTGAFVVVLAVTGASRLIRYFTRFVDEIFAALISIIFIVEAARDVIHAFPASHVPDDAALLGLVLALGTYTVARKLARLRRRPYLRRPLREALGDFGPAIAVMTMVFARHLLPTVVLPPLDVPLSFTTTSGRPWLVAVGDVPSWVPWASAIPAVFVTVLVFLDQNVTVRIVNNRENRLTKGAAYHLDLLVVGLLIGLFSIVGLPWLVAATVRSVNHVRALTVFDERKAPNPPQITGVLENRVSPFLVHAFIGLALLATAWLREIPMPVLYGLFLYMGMASMVGNQFFERLRLWLTDPELYPPTHYVRLVRPRAMHAYTAVQLGCLTVLWVVKSSTLALLFPLFIALLVPVRMLIGKYFTPAHLKALDADEVPTDVEEGLGGP